VPFQGLDDRELDELVKDVPADDAGPGDAHREAHDLAGH
jgi:hypothetical protein